jgi:hypothetical protein
LFRLAGNDRCQERAKQGRGLGAHAGRVHNRFIYRVGPASKSGLISGGGSDGGGPKQLKSSEKRLFPEIST